MSSDHLPVIFELPIVIPLNSKILVRNFAKANWKKFRNSVKNNVLDLLPPVNSFLATSNEIDRSIETFSQILHDSADISIPLRKPYRFRYKFSQKVKDLISERNFLRKHSRRYPALKAEVNDLNRKIKLEISLDSKFNWHDKMASLNSTDLSLFKMAKSFKRKNCFTPPLRISDDAFAYSDTDKAEILASTFLKSHQIDNQPSIYSEEVNSSLNKIFHTNPVFERYNFVFPEEIYCLISNLKTKKSAGLDSISSSMIKNLPSEAIFFPCRLFNSCLNIGYFSNSWKVGKIIAILKPSKDKHMPSSYRPISLLSIISKLLEKIILSRMLEFDDGKIMKAQQFGFRAKHSTVQQVLRIVETISLRFNNDKSTAMTLLDIEKAFDAVWHDALLHKILSLNFPSYLVKIVSSFLNDRFATVSVGSSQSTKYSISAGVPQGSPLSPYLFNIFINDMPIPKHCKIACYADDTAIISSIKNYDLETLTKRLEDGLSKIHKFFASWKIKINSTKTESILFSHSNIMRKKQNQFKIKFLGTDLEWLPTVKYLGVILDTKLLMKQNIENNIKKARQATGILFPLLKKFSGVPVKEKVTLYRSYIRPILTYACPVFANAAKCHLKKLQVAQNKNLRMVLSARYRTRIQSLHKKANIPMMSEFISKLTENFYKTSATSTNTLVKRLGVYSHRTLPPKLKHKLPRPFP